MKTVYVGLSGGVDSSVAALLLKEQGYRVVGVYMKNWSKDLPGMPCPWKEDYQDAKRVAVQLGIDFKMYDFETEYFDKVVEYMLDGFRAGITPNPDIMCNQEIKFKLFLDTALDDGADFTAMGHYAKVVNSNQQLENNSVSENLIPNSKHKIASLLQAKDSNKDQTYFLYRVTEDALAKTLFPLGDLTKPEVREIAKKANLVTADKSESMGICFVGKVGIKEFLEQYVEQQPGPVINQKKEIIGTHNGAIFYTIGQRHGINVGGGLPYYVVGKSMKNNEVYVTTDLQDGRLWSNKLTLTSMHWINHKPSFQGPALEKMSVRTRHRAKLIGVKKINQLNPDNLDVELEEDVRAITPGQSAVFYLGNHCLGGGIVI